MSDNDKQKQTKMESSQGASNTEGAKGSELKKNKEKIKGDNKVKSSFIKIPKGDLLEYRIKRLLFHMGYFPKTNVFIKSSIDDGADPITDLDVYGISVLNNFSTKTLWADCKSGSVRVHERISWIKGVKEEANIDEVLFVAPNVRTTVKQYAGKSNIRILDVNLIERLEGNYNIAFNDWKGSWNPYEQLGYLNKLSNINVPTIGLYKKIAKFISTDFWVLDCYSQLKKTITGIKDLYLGYGVHSDPEVKRIIKMAIYELITLLTLAVLTIVKETLYFKDEEKKEIIFDALSSGDIPNKKRKEIFDAAFRYAYSMIKRSKPDIEIPVEMPVINITPPNYAPILFELILRINKYPTQYTDVLRFIDVSLMEYELQSKPLDRLYLNKIFNNNDELIRGVKTILHFVCEITDIPRAFFMVLE